MLALEDIASCARLLCGLPVFLRQRMGPEQARRVLRQRLERREADFLALVRRAVYANDPSPYRSLLELSGCEYGDLEQLLGREGVEGTLRSLYQRVYISPWASSRVDGRSFAAARRFG
jgi:hypothetical protein